MRKIIDKELVQDLLKEKSTTPYIGSTDAQGRFPLGMDAIDKIVIAFIIDKDDYGLVRSHLKHQFVDQMDHELEFPMEQWDGFPSHLYTIGCNYYVSIFVSTKKNVRASLDLTGLPTEFIDDWLILRAGTKMLYRIPFNCLAPFKNKKVHLSILHGRDKFILNLQDKNRKVIRKYTLDTEEHYITYKMYAYWLNEVLKRMWDDDSSNKKKKKKRGKKTKRRYVVKTEPRKKTSPLETLSSKIKTVGQIIEEEWRQIKDQFGNDTGQPDPSSY